MRRVFIGGGVDACILAGGGVGGVGRGADKAEAGISEGLLSSWVSSPTLKFRGFDRRRATSGDGIIPLKAYKMRQIS